MQHFTPCLHLQLRVSNFSADGVLLSSACNPSFHTISLTYTQESVEVAVQGMEGVRFALSGSEAQRLLTVGNAPRMYTYKNSYYNGLLASSLFSWFCCSWGLWPISVPVECQPASWQLSAGIVWMCEQCDGGRQCLLSAGSNFYGKLTHRFLS